MLQAGSTGPHGTVRLVTVRVKEAKVQVQDADKGDDKAAAPGLARTASGVFSRLTPPRRGRPMSINKGSNDSLNLNASWALVEMNHVEDAERCEHGTPARDG